MAEEALAEEALAEEEVVEVVEVDKTASKLSIYVLLIPALNPDYRLVDLVKEVHLQNTRMKIIVIDDGSASDFQPLFEGLKEEGNCILIHHPKNLGKGAVLKTGIRYIMECFPDCAGIVTADCDGQHSPTDILRIAEAIEKHPDSLILGTRDFSSTKVPFKGRYGNRIASGIFKLVTGKTCSDTQTGLRGIAGRATLSATHVVGERYCLLRV